MKKILILVLATNTEKYLRMVDAIKNTWAHKNNIPDNIIIKFYYGKKHNEQNDFIEIGDDLYTPNVEEYSSLTKKMIDAFTYYKDYDFDYIFRPCDGSYINLDLLNKWIHSFPNHDGNIYRGVAGNNFVSGSGFLISKDVLNIAISNLDKYMYNVVDDVELGRILTGNGVTISTYNVSRYNYDENCVDIFDSHGVGSLVKLQNSHIIHENYLETIYHYHIRNIPQYMYDIHNQVINYKSKV